MSYIPDGSQFPLSNTIGLFLEILDEPTWNDMNAGINAFLNDPTTDPTGELYPLLGVQVSLSDGTVAYQSYTQHSTYLAFSTKTPNAINENQNSRLANLTALMSNAGTGYEKKYSSINQQDRVFYATRMGSSAQHALGVVKVGVNANNDGGSDRAVCDPNDIECWIRWMDYDQDYDQACVQNFYMNCSW